MVTVKVISKYKGEKPKWYDNFIGQTFECYPKISLSETYTIFHLTDKGLEKLSLLKGKRSLAALIYPENCKIIMVGNVPVKQIKVPIEA